MTAVGAARYVGQASVPYLQRLTCNGVTKTNSEEAKRLKLSLSFPYVAQFRRSLKAHYYYNEYFVVLVI